jgi:hypothetical protein
METTQGISLCNYLFLKLAKALFFLSYLLCVFFYKIGGWGGRRKVAQIMYTHVSKCKNDK